MKRLKFIFLYLSFGLSFLNSSGQEIGNYVNNGSFEVALASATSSPFDAVKFWGPLDSINNNAYYLRSKLIGTVPSNSTGYQIPLTGGSYILTTFYCSICGNLQRGYPRNRLKQVLKSNTAYCVKFSVVNTNNCIVGIDQYGIYLGDSSLDTIKYCMLPLSFLTPQVKWQGGIIGDTLNWISITGTFVANGIEKYLVLGNFNSNPATQTVILNPTYLPYQSNDIYIDDVSLIEVNLNAYAGPDKLIYPGDSTFIGRQPDFAIDPGCRWYKLPNLTTAIDTISGLWVKPSTTSTYVVRQELDCSPLKWDTVVVTVSHNLIGLNNLQRLSDNITLFPNPTSGNLNISFSGSAPSDIASYFITDNLGQNIREEDLQSSSISVSTSDLAPGLYQIHLRTPFGTVTKKFVKAD